MDTGEGCKAKTEERTQSAQQMCLEEGQIFKQMGEVEKFSPKDKTDELWKKKKDELDQKNVREFKVSNISLPGKPSESCS